MVGVVVSDDLIVQILAKLPVKSLLRFSCVCKTWYSVISDPRFSTNWHQMQPSLLICEKHREFSTKTIDSLLAIKDRAPTPTPLSLPWETEEPGVNICLGSSNGLICMDHRSSSSLIIGNPSTRKFKRLPPRPVTMRANDSLPWIYAWFGYDESIDDYKLVWLTMSDAFYYPPIVAELHVFTLKSNTWRRSSVDHVAVVGLNKLLEPATGVLSNGAIHWITRDCFSCDEMRILVLDLANEKLGVLEFTHASLNLSSQIGSLGGCLCLCTDAYQDVFGFRFVRDLWMMQEYGVDSSWTKLMSIPRPCGAVVCPILLSKEGKEMVIICTLASGGIAKLRVEEEGGKEVRKEILSCAPGDPFRSKVILHMEESLVSISPTH